MSNRSSATVNLRKNALKLCLLVLLIIISPLFFVMIGYSEFNRLRDKARKTSALAAASALRQACLDYYDDESQLPLNEGMTSDRERVSSNELMQVLSYDGELPRIGSHRTVYFRYKDAAGKPNDRFDGLDTSLNQIRLLGPWKNKVFSDRYYRLVMDYDFDQEIQEPSALDGERIVGERVLIYHLGKDGEAGQGKNKDNVYSYK